MSTDPIGGGGDGNVAPLRALDAGAEARTTESPGPAYADLSDGRAQRKPVIPAHWRTREAAREHVRLAAREHVRLAAAGTGTPPPITGPRPRLSRADLLVGSGRRPAVAVKLAARRSPRAAGELLRLVLIVAGVLLGAAGAGVVALVAFRVRRGRQNTPRVVHRITSAPPWHSAPPPEPRPRSSARRRSTCICIASRPRTSPPSSLRVNLAASPRVPLASPRIGHTAMGTRKTTKPSPSSSPPGPAIGGTDR
jgi:hypothetical protein